MQETGDDDSGDGEGGEGGEELIVTMVTGYDPKVTPGIWRESKVGGFAWFEPAMFDPEVYDVEYEVEEGGDE